MERKNYLVQAADARQKSMHGGQGQVFDLPLFTSQDFETPLRYVSHLRLPPGTSVGDHRHPNQREEIYLVLEGSGTYRCDGTEVKVTKGDVLLNRIEETHGLVNTGSEDLEVFVFWVERSPETVSSAPESAPGS